MNLIFLTNIYLLFGTGCTKLDDQAELGGIIEGYIQTEESHQPLEGISVMIRTLDGITMSSIRTDSDGYYKSELLDVGTYNVQCVRGGYEDIVRGVDVNPQKVTTLRIMVLPE